jgi:hypothetical protein
MLKAPTLETPRQDEPAASPLSALEISGAICAKVVHDLSNLTSGIIGNAEYAQGSGPHPESLQRALEAISRAANSAGKILGQCLPLQRLVTGEAAITDAAEAGRRITESAVMAPGWRVEAIGPLTGQVRVQPRWLAAAVWQIVLETESPRGEIHLSCGPAVFPVVWRGIKRGADGPPDFFQIAYRYRSEQMLFSTDGPANPERFGLLAVHELIRRFRGQIHARPKPPGRQEISILIPMG